MLSAPPSRSIARSSFLTMPGKLTTLISSVGTLTFTTCSCPLGVGCAMRLPTNKLQTSLLMHVMQAGALVKPGQVIRSRQKSGQTKTTCYCQYVLAIYSVHVKP